MVVPPIELNMERNKSFTAVSFYLDHYFQEDNVKFCWNRAICGFSSNALLNVFYYFSFIFLFLLFSSFDAVAFNAVIAFMQLSISAFNVLLWGARLFARPYKQMVMLNICI